MLGKFASELVHPELHPRIALCDMSPRGLNGLNIRVNAKKSKIRGRLPGCR